MNEQTAKASELATWFESFITAHPVVTCIVLAWVISWTLTITGRPFLQRWFADDIERAVVRLFDVALAFVAAFLAWPGEHPLLWAAAIGGSSPVAYLALSELICWKWPNLRPHLSLREFTAEPTPEPPKDYTP